METFSSVAKRKKRKTRKCLDEIRKRSRRNANDLEQSSFVNQISRTANFIGIKPGNICITSNRLTLAMFPKVIRSETITRPVVPESNSNPDINFDDSKKNTKPLGNVNGRGFELSLQSNSDSDLIKNSDKDCVSSPCNKYSKVDQLSIDRDSVTGNESTQNNSPASFLLFSPNGQAEDSDIFEVSANDGTLSSTSSPSSQSTREGYGYHFYEEFMNEIPIYLRRNTPALIKEDVMKKTKSFLHSIYLESCQQECEDNILHCMRNSVIKKKKCFIPEEPTISPLEYLRLSQMSQKHVCSTTEMHTLQDTPDYRYYPHKLNH